MSRVRLGITTRITKDNRTNEHRDCLAQDWAIFFKEVLPEVDWMMLPNIGRDITSYIRHWGLDVLILSGGNDLGEFQLREETEKNLITFATEQAIPLLGICRGFQLLAAYFGGRLEQATPGEHPTTPHPVIPLESPLTKGKNTLPAEVNSFHSWLVRDSGSLTPFITDPAGNIEGVYSSTHPIIGLGWHPERMSPATDFDRQLIREFFLKQYS